MNVKLELGMEVYDPEVGLGGKVIAWVEGQWVIFESKHGECASCSRDILIIPKIEGNEGGLDEKQCEDKTFHVGDMVMWSEEELPYLIVKMTETWCIMSDLQKPQVMVAVEWNEVWALEEETKQEFLSTISPPFQKRT